MAEAKLFEALKLGKKIPESNTFLFQGAPISSLNLKSRNADGKIYRSVSIEEKSYALEVHLGVGTLVLS